MIQQKDQNIELGRAKIDLSALFHDCPVLPVYRERSAEAEGSFSKQFSAHKTSQYLPKFTQCKPESRMCSNIFSIFSVTAGISFAVRSRDQDDRASLSVHFTDFVLICLKSRHIHTGEHDPGGTSCSVQSPLRLIGEEAMKHGIPLYIAVYLFIHHSVYD